MSLLVLAHRGSPLLAPENTIAAFGLALKAGCDGCECDVQLSRDGMLVVFHDETLTRMTGLARRIPALTIQQLAALQLHGPGCYPTMETNIPTLEAVWRLHRERRKLLFAELKYFSEEHTPREQLGEAVLRFVRAQRPGRSFYAISFDEPLLQWLKERRPTLRTGYIFNEPQRFAAHQSACARWADVMLPRADCVSTDIMAWARRVKRPVYAWVADDEPTMTRLAALGANGLLTNEPVRLVAWAKHRSE